MSDPALPYFLARAAAPEAWGLLVGFLSAHLG